MPGKAEATPTATPRVRAIASRADKLALDIGARAAEVDDAVGLHHRHADCGADRLRLAARRRAVIEVEQPALADLAQKRQERPLVAGEARAHVVHHAGIGGHAAEVPAQILVARPPVGRDEQGVLAGILLRIARRLQRDLQDDLVAFRARLVDPALQARPVGREGERDALRQRRDGFLRPGLAEPHAAHDDRDAGHAGHGRRRLAGIDLAGATPVRRDARQRAEGGLLDQAGGAAAGRGRHPHERGELRRLVRRNLGHGRGARQAARRRRLRLGDRSDRDGPAAVGVVDHGNPDSGDECKQGRERRHRRSENGASVAGGAATLGRERIVEVASGQSTPDGQGRREGIRAG